MNLLIWFFCLQPSQGVTALFNLQGAQPCQPKYIFGLCALVDYFFGKAVRRMLFFNQLRTDKQ